MMIHFKVKICPHLVWSVIPFIQTVGYAKTHQCDGIYELVIGMPVWSSCHRTGSHGASPLYASWHGGSGSPLQQTWQDTATRQTVLLLTVWWEGLKTLNTITWSILKLLKHSELPTGHRV